TAARSTVIVDQERLTGLRHDIGNDDVGVMIAVAIAGKRPSELSKLAKVPMGTATYEIRRVLKRADGFYSGVCPLQTAAARSAHSRGVDGELCARVRDGEPAVLVGAELTPVLQYFLELPAVRGFFVKHGLERP